MSYFQAYNSFFLTSHLNPALDLLPRAGLVLDRAATQHTALPNLLAPQVSLICQTPRHERERRSAARDFLRRRCRPKSYDPEDVTRSRAVPYETRKEGVKMGEIHLEVENKHIYDIPNRLDQGTASHEVEALVQS